MATAKNGNKKPQGNKQTKKITKDTSSARKEVSAIVLFCISLFLICVTFIKGGGLWGMLRTLIFGLFGFSSFLCPIILIYIAIIFAIDKTSSKVAYKIVEAISLVFLICSAIHIFKFNGEADFLLDIEDAFNLFRYENSFLGGGAVGAIIGGGILIATGSSKAAAIAIILILSFLCLMLVTGTTLIRLFKGIWKPVQKASEYTEDKITQIKEREKPKFDPDVDLGPMPDDESKKGRGHKKQSEEPIQETLDEIIEELPKADEPISSKPVLLDDIIKNLNSADEANSKSQVSTEEKIVDEASKVVNEIIDENAPVKVYKLPPLDCLNFAKVTNKIKYEDELKLNATKLVDTLKSFGVETRVVDISRGPSVTRYEIQPAAGVKISRITTLSDDIALNLAASGVRIEAPIPNKAAVGIEVPNKNRSTVTLREIIDTDQYKKAKSKLFVALGKDIAGNTTYADLSKMPHLLIAGTTGSGKSVCLNSMIVSILYNATPDEVKLLMIDPKQVEFTVYNGIPHLIVPVVSDPRKASGALAWAVTEMLTRYKTFSENNVRDIAGYNSICETNGQKKMPQIVIFIDELSDLMMAAPHEVEDSICRLAQMARAAGMHLVIATQRPSVDVITGIIKANIPSRISLSVSSQIDSRTIIDTVGAEKLLGNGDMLFYPVGIAKPVRIQGCYLSDKEVENVVDFIKGQEQSVYDDEVMKEIERQAAMEKKKNSGVTSSDEIDGDTDEMLPKAIEVVVESQMASTTLLQRKLKLGYARAARIIDNLEERGIIGPYEGSKPRKVLVTKQQWYEMNALAQGGASKDYTMEDTPQDEENNE
ncbi:MAG: DNA translocase FtsK [Oscillospiraceae bacterium]